MALMNDFFKRGYPFDGAAGLKTGANLEDLATRLVPVAGTQMVDQSTIVDYADGTILDDTGSSVRRLKVGSINGTHITNYSLSAINMGDDVFWGGPKIVLGAMQTSGTWNTAPSNVSNIYDGNDSTTWGDAKLLSTNSRVISYWDLGATYRGNIFIMADMRAEATNSYVNIGPIHAFNAAPNIINYSSAQVEGVRLYDNTSYITVTIIMPFYGRFPGMFFLHDVSGSACPAYWAVRRFEVYGRAV
jgi:hypothetical protein